MAVFDKPLVLLGPTASGKSAVALSIARRVHGEIVSLDSMQVYRGMDVGTAKPTPSEQAEVKHHLIDLVEPDETYSVAHFVQAADNVIAAARARKTPLILTGGTPLYYKALFEGLFEGPSADAAIRSRLTATPAPELVAKLRSVDPAAADRIHLNDTRRLIRALEVYELTGQPISSFQSDWARAVQRHPAFWVGLQWDREALNRRINARTKAMIADGWLQETKRLLDSNIALSKTAAEATGYADLMRHLRGEISLEEATEQIKIATRQLARRQMKWFRRFPNVLWLPADRPPEEIAAEVTAAWKAAAEPATAAEVPPPAPAP